MTDPGTAAAASSAPLPVMVIDAYGTSGGSARWLVDLLGAAEGLRPHGLLLRDGPLRSELEQMGIPTEVLPTGPSAGAILRAGLRLPRHLRASATIVVLANGVKAAAVAAVGGRLARVPVVWAKHDFSHDRRLGRRLARQVDLVIGTSRAVVESVGVPSAPVLSPPRPSTPPADVTAAQRFWRDRGIDVADGPTAAVVGRLTPYKRVEDAIRALTDGACDDWRLVVIGADDWASPGERTRLERLAASLHVIERVRFAGEVPDVGHWLAAFDAVVVPTSVDDAGIGGEGFSIVVLESLLAGVPVIGTEGIPALALGADAIITVAPEHPQGIAAGLATVNTRVSAAQAKAVELRENYPDAGEVAAELVRLLRSVAGA